MEPFAYHTVVHALEAGRGWTEDRRFAAAVEHAIQGHLAYSRYHAAGWRRAREGIGEAGVARLVDDFLETDINPAISIISALRHPASALAAYNAYNAAADLAVRTSVTLANPASQGIERLAARRSMIVDSDDPHTCRTATLSVMGSVLEHVQSGGRRMYRPTSLSRLAEFLGRGHGVAADVARAIEDDWLAPVADLPRKLGCQKRTLERRLKEVGLTAQALRRADRMMRATAGLFSGDSATAIAFDCGFSDVAHMSRSFRIACGMTPSMLVAVIRHDEMLGHGPSRLPYQRPQSPLDA
jgi:AraC-like DNA-binding protein